MSTPIGHSITGYWFYHFSNIERRETDWRRLVFFLIFANLADIDYLFGFIHGQPNLYHHQFTHSIAFAVIIAGVFAGLERVDLKNRFWASFLILFAAYGSHVLIDYFTLDTTPPYGEQLFWPFDKNYYISKFSIFRDIHKGDTTGDFLRNLFSTYNWITGLTEIGIFVSIGFVVQFIRKLMLGRNK